MASESFPGMADESYDALLTEPSKRQSDIRSDVQSNNQTYRLMASAYGDPSPIESVRVEGATGVKSGLRY
jgi:hypothetical protein